MLQALRAGDQEAFRELVSLCDAGLRRFARGYVSPSLAEDAVAETWLSVVRSIDRFEGRSSLKTWIYRILINTVRTLAGREARVIPFAAMGHGRDDGGQRTVVGPEDLDGAILGPGYLHAPPSRWDDMPADELQRVELLEMILEAIDALPPAQREVVHLRDVEGLSAVDVSTALEISAVNQRVLLHRGRVAVRRRLEEYLTHAG